MKKNIFERFERGPSYDDLFLFFLQMQILYSSGNSSLKAVNDLFDQTENSVLKRSLQKMSKDLYNGESLAVTLLKQKCFPPFCGHIIAAGEESGKLETCLEQISYHMEQTSDIIRRIVTAIIPVITAVVVMIIAMTIFLIYVSPFFEEMFSSLDIELPLLNLIIIKTSKFLADYWSIVLLILTGTCWTFWKYAQKNPIVIDKILLKVPIYKTIHYNFLQYRFVKIFKLVRESGIGSLQAIDLTADAIGNEIMAQMLHKTAASMRNGFGLPQALEANNKNQIMSIKIINLIKSGEMNGAKDLNESLEKTAGFFKKFVQHKTERFGDAITPWILIPAFIIVMLIILSVQGPMLMMNQGI